MANEYCLNSNANVDNVELITMFNEITIDDFSPQCRKYWDELPNMVTVYRGCTAEELDAGLGAPLGISWTFNFKVADFFASRFWNKKDDEDKHYVVEAIVPKTMIKWIDFSRTEDEAIIPCLLEDEIEGFHEATGHNDFDFDNYNKECQKPEYWWNDETDEWEKF